MYKLLVVEDEETIRRGISESINWHELGFEICGEAVNGKDAMNRIENNIPDVVLTDVRMPVVDGLELSKWINENHNNIIIIILSGFAEFEYAKSAIKFKVFEYLLKPTNKNVFIDTFSRLKKILDKEKLDEEINSKNISKLNAGLSRLRNEFIINLVKNDFININTLIDKLNYLELDFSGDNFTVSVIRIDAELENYHMEWQNDHSLLRDTCNTIINDLLDEANSGTVAAENIREIIVIINLKESMQSGEYIRRLMAKAVQNIKKLVFNDSSVKIYAGIGLTYPDISQVNKSYRQALDALGKGFFEGRESYYLYESASGEKPADDRQWLENYSGDLEQTVSAALNGKASEAGEGINKLFNQYTAEAVGVKYIKQYSYFLVFLLSANLSDLDSYPGIIDGIDAGYEQQIMRMATLNGLQEYLSGIFIGTAEKISLLQDTDNSRKIISKAKNYINKSYSKSISLEELSRHVYLSPSYLSFLFKNVTGENYSEYLKKFRMKEAQKMLRKPDLKIYEIAERVGFNEYKYFAVQFKKMFGISPGKYRENS